MSQVCSAHVFGGMYTQQCWVVFNPELGQIWTNPNVGLKMSFKIVTQLQLSTLHFFKLHF